MAAHPIEAVNHKTGDGIGLFICECCGALHHAAVTHDGKFQRDFNAELAKDCCVPVTCETCGETVKDRYALISHRYAHIPKQVAIPATEWGICICCGLSCNNASDSGDIKLECGHWYCYICEGRGHDKDHACAMETEQEGKEA